MVDNVYVADDYFATNTHVLYDDGIGTDWVIISGTYTTTGIGVGFFGCRVHLDWVNYYEPRLADQRVFIEAITYPLQYHDLRIYGTIENVMGGGGVEELVGDANANILQGDPTDVAGMRDYIWGAGGNDTLLGVGGDDYLDGGDGNDLIFGDLDPEAQDQGNIAAGSDSLYGGAGDDTLVGGSGANEIAGGDGFDTATYAVYHDGFDWGYRLVCNLQTGVATVYEIDWRSGTESVFAVDTISGIEHVRGTDGGDYLRGVNAYVPGSLTRNSADGGAGNDTIVGSWGVDDLIGGTGNDMLNDNGNFNYTILADRMTGGAGDDTYTLTVGNAIVVEAANEGHDRAYVHDSYQMVDNLEDATLVATFDGAFLIGNALANRMTGDRFANTMTGLGGADTMIGGGGNDSYSYYGTETIIERLGGGIDTVTSYVSITLAAQVENLFLSDYGRAINGTGNGLANVLTGNGSANWLNGGAGADTLLGGAGNDTYVTDGLDTIIEDSSRAGTDTVRSTASYALGFSLENLVLLGTADLSGTGNGGTNRLIGNTGANWLYGGGGNDSIWGGGGDDRLIGGAGADRLSGGGGNDTYVTDGLDTIIEDSLSAGTDTVSSPASYTLGFALENLTLLGTGNLSGTGNGAANRLIGTTGANWLNGGGGNDSIWGGGGDDRLIGGAGADRLTGGAGTDRFLFASTSGADTVVDFQDGIDHLVFITGGAPVLPVSVTDSGLNVLVQYGAASITLLNVDHTLIGAADFIFA